MNNNILFPITAIAASFIAYADISGLLHKYMKSVSVDGEIFIFALAGTVAILSAYQTVTIIRESLSKKLSK